MLSLDLQSKSTDWFLYDGTLVVKGLIYFVNPLTGNTTLSNNTFVVNAHKAAKFDMVSNSIRL